MAKSGTGEPLDRRLLLGLAGLAGLTVAGAGVIAATRPAGPAEPAPQPRRPRTRTGRSADAAWAGLLRAHRFGVSLAGLEFGENIFPGRYNAEVQLPPADRYRYYASKGLRSVRLPYLWERFQPELFGEIDGRLDLLSTDRGLGTVLYKDVIHRQLDLAHAQGVAVILDPHNYGARALRRDGDWVLTGGTGRNGRFAIGSPEVPIAAFADFAGKLAREFGDHPALIGLDLMNEPVKLPRAGATWSEAAQAAIDQVRQVNNRLFLFVEGYNYANPFGWDRFNPDLHRLRDPEERLVFSAHLYFDENHSGRYAADEAIRPRRVSTPARALADIAPFFQWLDRHGLRGHVGEFGAPDTPAWRPIVRQFIAQCRQRPIMLHAWADWPKPSDYVLQLNPQGGPDKALIDTLSAASGALHAPRR